MPSRLRRLGLSGLLLGAAALLAPGASAADLKGGKLRVAIIGDMTNFDPMQFSTVNFPLIKNLYDSLIEYTPDGKAVPSLASDWKIAPDATSVTVTLRKDVKFQSGAPLTADAVAATLKKGADPQKGKNVYATMSFVKDWTVVDPQTIRLNFNGPAPERQVTDLLQFLSVIDPAGIDTVEAKPAGAGPFTLGERVVGQRIVLKKNPAYWRDKEPVVDEVTLTVFTEDAAASAALESGAVDMVYGSTARSAVRLRDAGYQLIQGPGPLVQVFRINSTRGPFKNAKFRQAFNYLMDRQAILRAGYAGLGEVVALPWAPASPAFDKSYNQAYAFNIDKAKALLAESGLPAAEMSNWKLLVNGSDEPSVLISQIVQGSLAKAGINTQLDVQQGAEFIDALLKGRFDAVFGGVGNVQKFPTRVATNSIYRTSNNPILGTPHPHPEYVAAIDKVGTTTGSGDQLKAAYDALNKSMVEAAFAIPTNTYDTGLTLAAKNVSGFTLDIDNMLVLRTVGFKP
ncbi:ABC transporter substrate-binding protein [Alsobacter sp. SYSU M60028]|uniref:ABC transporter substrate-binding protein n=1 Tax=Alsobacter ponti TaxID=2962936 RepID=A0ABT1LBW1_9HYPH|nr:ABC transporter substrate-binding protein [Alsobacter ponti]MCP8938451.1 ABC transporter substrate-binding protein [Alsobacter ponti]